MALFWKVKFPLQARSFQKDHRMKYIHITFVAIGILVPVIPVVATISQFTHGKSSAEAVKGGFGFGITRFPPLMCTGKHGNTIFYSFTVPSVVMVMIGIALMASLFWIIHKVSEPHCQEYKIPTALHHGAYLYDQCNFLIVFANFLYNLSIS